MSRVSTRSKFKLLTFPAPSTTPSVDDPIGEAVAYLRRHKLGAYDALGEIVLNTLDDILAHHERRHAGGDWVYPEPPTAIDVEALRSRHSAIVETIRRR